MAELPNVQAQPPSPEGQSMGPGAPPVMPEEGAPNPVVTALQDLMTFVGSQQEQGNPRAQEMMSAFQAFVQTLQGGPEAPPEMPQPQAPPMQAPGAGGQTSENIKPMGVSPVL